ncbi:MAG: iron-containing alcohol dehydrogenase [Thermodesulfobacteriota bacterium]
MQMSSFRSPGTIHFGEGATQRVGQEAARCGATKVLCVTDPMLKETGVIAPVLDALHQEGLDPVVFDGVDTEPCVEHVQEGMRLLQEEGCDALVACGGGSPIDAAKAIAIQATNSADLAACMGIDKIPSPGLPVLAVPTTAGTGSEATMVTIITDTETNVKMMIMSPYLLPCAAIVDPVLTLKCPRHITASTGLDALTHAIEAYVSVKANAMSDVLALSAAGLLNRFLPRAWANPDDLEARSQVHLGALQAGMAFTNSSVALVHGMSRPIGAKFHVPHGVSNAALLGLVTDFSLIGAPHRYARLARAMDLSVAGLTDLEAGQCCADRTKELIAQLKIPSLSALGVKRGQLEAQVQTMTEDALASGSPGNNPRKATREEIIELYFQAL